MGGRRAGGRGWEGARARARSGRGGMPTTDAPERPRDAVRPRDVRRLKQRRGPRPLRDDDRRGEADLDVAAGGVEELRRDLGARKGLVELHETERDRAEAEAEAEAEHPADRLRQRRLALEERLRDATKLMVSWDESISGRGGRGDSRALLARSEDARAARARPPPASPLPSPLASKP